MLIHLDLNVNSLGEIPDDVLSMSQLEVLTIADDQIAHIALDSFHNLTGLISLDMSK